MNFGVRYGVGYLVIGDLAQLLQLGWLCYETTNGLLIVYLDNLSDLIM